MKSFLGAPRPLFDFGQVFNDRPYRVLDLGGASGIHYWAARQLVPKETRLDWRVVETSPMAKWGGRG